MFQVIWGRCCYGLEGLTLNFMRGNFGFQSDSRRNSIQREGHCRYHCVPDEIWWNTMVNGNDSIPIWEDNCLKENLKVNNKLNFLFLNTLLYIVYSYYFYWDLPIFYLLFFLPQIISILNIISKVWTIISLPICITKIEGYWF